MKISYDWLIDWLIGHLLFIISDRVHVNNNICIKRENNEKRNYQNDRTTVWYYCIMMIGRIYLVVYGSIIIKLEVSTFPIIVIFVGCVVSGAAVPSCFAGCLHIDPMKLGVCSHFTTQSMKYVNKGLDYGQKSRIHWFSNCTFSLSSLCRFV